MIEVLLGISYIFIFCLCIGMLAYKIGGRFLELPQPGVTGLVVAGAITITVMTGWFSLLMPISGMFHVLMLVVAVVSAACYRKDLMRLFGGVKPDATGMLCMAAVALAVAYAASRGSFHTDTGIYHAAAIRQYEEYGCLKGAANIQTHYGYNSSYLGFCAFFSLSFLLDSPLHVTTAFLMVLFSVDALLRLRDFRSRSVHCADACRIGTLLYVMMNYTGAISPATDYGTMLMTAYFLTCWAGLAETDDNPDECGVLAIFGLFLTTMKLSAAMCTIVSVFPIFLYLKNKNHKRILFFICLGLICFGFYPVRNVVLSGWLFYPFEAIDLFDVKWKLPREYSLLDSNQIKVWGRCLFDVDKIDMPVSDWLPIWWEAQEHYDQMLMYGCVLSVLLIALTFAIRRMRADVMVLYLTCGANLGIWFFTAPFVRYGLVFLMTIPLLALTGFCDAMRDVDKRSIKEGNLAQKLCGAAGFALSLSIMICFCARIDHYVMDDLVFIKHEASAPYYACAKPYDSPQMQGRVMNDSGVTVYYSVDEEEKNSYYVSPSTCYGSMLDRCVPIGDDVRDGFKPVSD